MFFLYELPGLLTLLRRLNTFLRVQRGFLRDVVLVLEGVMLFSLGDVLERAARAKCCHFALYINATIGHANDVVCSR